MIKIHCRGWFLSDDEQLCMMSPCTQGKAWEKLVFMGKMYTRCLATTAVGFQTLS